MRDTTHTVTASHTGKKRRRTRGDSRAHTECPHCLRRVHGEKGLKAHLAQVHGEARQ